MNEFPDAESVEQIAYLLLTFSERGNYPTNLGLHSLRSFNPGGEAVLFVAVGDKAKNFCALGKLDIMENFLQEKKQPHGINKILVVALLIAAVLVAGGVWLLTFVPTTEQQTQQMMAGAFLEGSPEFAAYTKNIIITTDLDHTSEGRLGLGTIQMAIHGDLRNRGDKTINLLELSVGVIDTKNQVVKEKKILVVPTQQNEILQPNETMKVFATLDGFTDKDDRANVRWKVTAIRFQ